MTPGNSSSNPNFSSGRRFSKSGARLNFPPGHDLISCLPVSTQLRLGEIHLSIITREKIKSTRIETHNIEVRRPTSPVADNGVNTLVLCHDRRPRLGEIHLEEDF